LFVIQEYVPIPFEARVFETICHSRFREGFLLELALKFSGLGFGLETVRWIGH
jgi:hypothetical protein